jgi:hypothetical protein
VDWLLGGVEAEMRYIVDISYSLAD